MLQPFEVSIDTLQNAQSSMAKIQNAINIVSAERARLGAYQNRLEHTLNNVQNYAENLSASESRIRDADMAKEMTELTRSQKSYPSPIPGATRFLPSYPQIPLWRNAARQRKRSREGIPLTKGDRPDAGNETPVDPRFFP